MSEIKPAEALAKASWVGDNNVIPYGSHVDVLAIDHGGRLDDILYPGLSSRAACWVRWWVGGYSPKYRSCYLADLNLTDSEYNKLMNHSEQKEKD